MATAPAASKVKNESSSVPLEKLFDDLEDDGTPKVQEDVKKALPGVKKPGNWDSDTKDGTSLPTFTFPTCLRC